MGSGKTTSFFFAYTYNANGWQDSRTRKDWNGAVWVNKYYIHTFDANGLGTYQQKREDWINNQWQAK